MSGLSSTGPIGCRYCVLARDRYRMLPATSGRFPTDLSDRLDDLRHVVGELAHPATNGRSSRSQRVTASVLSGRYFARSKN
jgi:hypothetical protein